MGQRNNIQFQQIQLESVSRELGLLEQIEINHPSKVVHTVIPVSIPDPKNSTQLMETTVRHEGRVLMSEEECEQQRDRDAFERTKRRITRAVTEDERNAILNELFDKVEEGQ